MEVRQRPRQFSWPLSAQETLRLHRLAFSTQTGPRRSSSPWQVPAPVCTPAKLRAPARAARGLPAIHASRHAGERYPGPGLRPRRPGRGRSARAAASRTGHPANPGRACAPPRRVEEDRACKPFRAASTRLPPGRSAMPPSGRGFPDRLPFSARPVRCSPERSGGWRRAAAARNRRIAATAIHRGRPISWPPASRPAIVVITALRKRGRRHGRDRHHAGTRG